MLKQIAERLLPSKTRFIDKISIEYGEILSQGDYESILFFMLPNLQWSEGLNGAVLDLAGPELNVYVRQTATTPRSGEVFATPAFETPYQNMFVAILAHWDGGVGFEERDLMNCYRHTIKIAQTMGIKSIAIPALGRDKRDFPHIRFARVALKAILESMDGSIERVGIYCADNRTLQTYQEQMLKLKRS